MCDLRSNVYMVTVGHTCCHRYSVCDSQWPDAASPLCVVWTGQCCHLKATWPLVLRKVAAGGYTTLWGMSALFFMGRVILNTSILCTARLDEDICEYSNTISPSHLTLIVWSGRKILIQCAGKWYKRGINLSCRLMHALYSTLAYFI